MKYCISDLHLFHTNILKYDNRPFTNITEHDETIIKNWNSVVNHDDEVYYLGDFCFKPHIAEKYVNRLNGRIYYIKGNHEQCLSSKIVRDRFEWIKDYYELKYQGHMFCMFHYAILEWNKGHRGSIHLHGHTHGGLMKKFPWFYDWKVLDMTANLWQYTPVSLDRIIELTKNKENIQHH